MCVCVCVCVRVCVGLYIVHLLDPASAREQVGVVAVEPLLPLCGRRGLARPALRRAGAVAADARRAAQQVRRAREEGVRERLHGVEPLAGVVP